MSFKSTTADTWKLKVSFWALDFFWTFGMFLEKSRSAK